MGDGRLSGNGCQDVDECLLATDDCVDETLCTNAPEGSFTCACPAGFGGDGRLAGTGCTDINECEEGTADCVAGATCMNNEGAFACLCAPGFQGDGRTGGSGCTDVNECTAGTAGCLAFPGTCTNAVGTFSCGCATGYTGDGVTACNDVDECSVPDRCGGTAVCRNVPGAFECVCPPGFRVASDADGGPNGCENAFEWWAPSPFQMNGLRYLNPTARAPSDGGEATGGPLQLDAGELPPVSFPPGVQSPSGMTAMALHPETGDVLGVVKVTGSRRLVRLQLARSTPDGGPRMTWTAEDLGDLGDKFSGLTYARIPGDAGVEWALLGVTGDGATVRRTVYRLSATVDADGGRVVERTALFATATGGNGDGEVIVYHPEDGWLYHSTGNSNVNFGRFDLQRLDAGREPVPHTGMAGETFGMVYFPWDHAFRRTGISSDAQRAVLVPTDAGVALVGEPIPGTTDDDMRTGVLLPRP